MSIVHSINNCKCEKLTNINFKRVSMRVLGSFFILLFIVGTISAEPINVRKEIKNLKNRDKNVKLTAIRKLGKSKDQSARRELRRMLKNEKHVHTKAMILETLTDSKDKELSEEAKNILKNDENAYLRHAAAVSLGNAKDDSAVPVLIEAFLNTDEKLGIRCAAGASLANYAFTEDVYGAYSNASNDPNPVIRKQVAVSISLSRGAFDKKTESLLKDMLKDEDEKVVKKVQQRLDVLGIKY